MTKEEFADFLKSTLNSAQVNDLILKGLHGTSARYYLEKSKDFIWENNIAEAINMVNKGLKLNDPEYNSQLLASRARYLESLENFEEAEKDYEKALSVANRNETNGSTHNLILSYAELLYRLNQNEKARPILEQGFGLPKISELFLHYNFMFELCYLKARMLFENGEGSRSYQCYSRAKNYLQQRNDMAAENFDDAYSVESYEYIKKFSPLVERYSIDDFF